MTTRHAAALAALDAARANLTTGAVRLDRALAAVETRRAIEQEGTCDNCSAPGPLVLAIDMPANSERDAAEPWLCRDCADLDAFQDAATNTREATLDLIAAVLDEHHPITTGSGATRCGGRTCWEWPCDKPAYRAAIRALGINEGETDE